MIRWKSFGVRGLDYSLCHRHRPFLVADLHLALLAAYIVVAVELVAIAAIRHRFFATSWWLSVLQVVGGGALVFAAAWIFGNA